MCKLTLNDYQAKPISDIYMTTITEIPKIPIKKQVKKAENYFKRKRTLKVIIKNIFFKISKIIKKDKFIPITNTIKHTIEYNIIKNTIITAVLKHDNYYINLTNFEKIDEEQCQLKNIEPISNYYSSNEIRFIERHNKIIFEVFNLKPYNMYKNKHCI